MQKSTEVPIYLKAKNKDELVKKMISNNMELSRFHPYQIMKDGNEWVAWFYADIKDTVLNKLEDL